MQEHLRQSGVPFACVRTAGFYGNYLSPMLSYMKQPDGSFVWSNNCGDDKYAWHAVEDIGQTTAGYSLLQTESLEPSSCFLFPTANFMVHACRFHFCPRPGMLSLAFHVPLHWCTASPATQHALRVAAKAACFACPDRLLPLLSSHF